VTRPRVSQARSAEEEIPTRRATSLMRRGRLPLRSADSFDKFFVLDTAPSFL
jgi:hypothetical protein